MKWRLFIAEYKIISAIAVIDHSVLENVYRRKKQLFPSIQTRKIMDNFPFEKKSKGLRLAVLKISIDIRYKTQN